MRTLVTIVSLMAALTAGPPFAQGAATAATSVGGLGSYVCPSHPQFQATWAARCPACRTMLSKTDTMAPTLVADKDDAEARAKGSYGYPPPGYASVYPAQGYGYASPPPGPAHGYPNQGYYPNYGYVNPNVNPASPGAFLYYPAQGYYYNPNTGVYYYPSRGYYWNPSVGKRYNPTRELRDEWRERIRQDHARFAR